MNGHAELAQASGLGLPYVGLPVVAPPEVRWDAAPCHTTERLRRTYLHLLHSYSHQQNPIYIGFSLLRTRRTILEQPCGGGERAVGG